MHRPVVLVDFDGVWTDLRGQAAAVVSGTHRRLAALSRSDPESVRLAIDRGRELVRRAPAEHGWLAGGRITAWSDEDPFLFHNATMAACDRLAAGGDRDLARLLEAVRAAGHADLDAFGSAAFSELSHAWLENHGHDLLPGAADALGSLTAIADVVICTNFAGEAIERTWARHGVRCAPAGTAGPLRLRGGARKQVLTGDPRREEAFAGRNVAVDRGFYRQVLLEERPAVVVGDVFSLDLALPLVLKREHPGFRGLRCIIMRTPFSSAWSLGLAAGPASQLEVIDHPGQLADLARGGAREGDRSC